MLIRTAVAADVDGIMTTHLSAISRICSTAYRQPEIDAWLAGGGNTDRYSQGIAEGRFVVALREETLVGFSDFDLAKGEVGGMFVAPSYVRRGIGRALLHEVEARAALQGVKRLHLQATLNAIAFYRSQGFILDEMSSFRLRSGVCLPCATMHKDLGAA